MQFSARTVFTETANEKLEMGPDSQVELKDVVKIWATKLQKRWKCSTLFQRHRGWSLPHTGWLALIAGYTTRPNLMSAQYANV